MPVKKHSHRKWSNSWGARHQHLAQVADLGCIVCLRQGRYSPAEIHHLRAGLGLSQKASPFRVLPLCPIHHRTGGRGTAFHAGRRTWETRLGSEEELLEEIQTLLGLNPGPASRAYPALFSLQ